MELDSTKMAKRVDKIRILGMMGCVFMMMVMVMMVARVEGHNDGGKGGHCDSNPEYRVQADYRFGVINVDGGADDWSDVDGFSFPLLPALDPDDDKQYPGGSINVKAVHDGRDIFFMLQVSGDYTYEKGYLDGKGPTGNDTSAQNDWKGAWWYDSLTSHSDFVEEDSPYSKNGQKGTYYFEFSRPLRTMDHLQQDVQFAVGQTSKLAVAFWYPVDGQPRSGSQHYSAYCDWIPFDISVPSGSSATKLSTHSSSGDAMDTFSILLSVSAFCVSIFVAYSVKKSRTVPFTAIGNL